MPSAELLFEPFRLKSLDLPNRIVMAPMTRNRSPDQVPGDDVAAYYRRRAEGGVGLIITEGTPPEHGAACDYPAVPAFFGEPALQGWANVVREVKAVGGNIVPQLWHMGAIRSTAPGADPDARRISPSGLSAPGRPVGEAMTSKDIDEAIEGFVRSSLYARQLGFDGIELHAAHGYLFDQFFWDATNERTDGYNGTLPDRTRFAVEAVSAIRGAVGNDFAIILRYSQWKQQDFSVRLANTPQELEHFLTPLVDAGVDIFDPSTRRFWEPAFPDTGSDLNLAGWTKKLTGVPSMTVGSVTLDVDFVPTLGEETAKSTGITRLLAMMERGDFDLVAVGRSLIVNPDWPRKIRDGNVHELLPYNAKSLEELV